jgi:glycosyltransferase involved in cell wall biosynthesis
MASKTVGLVAPLPPQVGGVSAFADWLLHQADAIGCRFDGFDLRGSTRGVGGELTVRALARQMALTPRYLSWLRRDLAGIHYCVSLTPTGLTRDLLFIALARLRRIPVIAHVHNVSDLDRVGSSWRLRTGMQLIDRLCQSIVVIAKIAQTRLEGIGVESRCISLAQRFSSPTVKQHVADNGELRVLFAGAYGRAKGLDELIAAMADLRSARPPFRLIVVGYEMRPGERSRLEALAQALNVDDAVEFHLPVPSPELRRYYETCDIVCLPSRREGFPMVLLEAMAFGLPPVATNVGGIPELIEDDVTGLLIEPGDAPALAAALARLSDTATRARIGEAASRRAAENGDGAADAAWRSLYDEVDRGRRGTGSRAE